jgi:hypothetical protein
MIDLEQIEQFLADNPELDSDLRLACYELIEEIKRLDAVLVRVHECVNAAIEEGIRER